MGGKRSTKTAEILPVRQSAATSPPRLRSEGMAPDRAALETGTPYSPGVWRQVGTLSSPTRALFAFMQVDGTGRSGPAAACPMGVALWSPLETRSLRPFWSDVRQLAIWGCTGEPAVLPQLRRGSPQSVAHGRDIDNFLSIGRSQAPSDMTALALRLATLILC
jgi:hypothetical protein